MPHHASISSTNLIELFTAPAHCAFSILSARDAEDPKVAKRDEKRPTNEGRPSARRISLC
jgi:hypothetical protein